MSSGNDFPNEILEMVVGWILKIAFNFGYVFFHLELPDIPTKQVPLLMDKILHHLGWLKPVINSGIIIIYHHPWWCRILSINSLQESPTINMWAFPKIGIPHNGRFIMENPTKMDDLGGNPLFLEITHVVTLVFLIMSLGVFFKLNFYLRKR